MRYIMIQMLIIAVALIAGSCSTDMFKYTIYSTKTGNRINLKQLAVELAEYDVVMFGEYHGNNTIHHIQAKLLPLYLREAGEIAISMEMFERDVQSVLNDYLYDEIPEAKFIAESRAWHTYQVDYRPIIEFAKEEGVPVIAANVPRRIADRVNRFGLKEINQIPTEDRFLAADEVTLTEDPYKDKFYVFMSNTPHISSMKKEVVDVQMENLYAAQSLKDDTMAESIYKFHRSHSDRKIIHFNGDFHSRSRLGVVTKLKMRNPNLKIAVIAPVLINEKRETPELPAMRSAGEFVIVVEQ